MRASDCKYEIADEFIRLGCSVWQVRQLGHPGLIVGKNRRTICIFAKDNQKPLRERMPTKDELDFLKVWKGAVEVVEGVYDVGVIVERLDR